MWSCNSVCVLNYTQSPFKQQLRPPSDPTGRCGNIPDTALFHNSHHVWVAPLTFPAWTVENPAEDAQPHIILTRLHWQLSTFKRCVKRQHCYCLYKYPSGKKHDYVPGCVCLFRDLAGLMFVKPLHILCYTKAADWSFCPCYSSRIYFRWTRQQNGIHFGNALINTNVPFQLWNQSKPSAGWLVVYLSIITGTFRVTAKTLRSKARLTCSSVQQICYPLFENSWILDTFQLPASFIALKYPKNAILSCQ